MGDQHGATAAADSVSDAVGGDPGPVSGTAYREAQRREAGAEMNLESEPQPEPAAQTIDMDLEPIPLDADEMAQAAASAGEFTSPFEDELDTPAFLRRRQNDQEDDTQETVLIRRARD